MMDRNILAGMFSASNMGQEVDTVVLQRLLTLETTDLKECVYAFCEKFMESKEHERAFIREGKYWYNTLSKLSDRHIKETWPHNYALYEHERLHKVMQEKLKV